MILDETRLSAMLDGLEKSAIAQATRDDTVGIERADTIRQMFREVIRQAILQALSINPHTTEITPTMPFKIVDMAA
jgi:hypothetical protein